MQAVLVLTGSGQMVLVQEENINARAKKHTDKLNNYIMKRASSSGDIAYLASPVTGGGIVVGRFQQIIPIGNWKGQKTGR
ncbi:MAG: hypothetical protein E6Q59_06620 [Nitrosomonas sp.]|nr:MAG: hypothetical protein E6Q59_06620 [Nitrosomonas sp.]